MRSARDVQLKQGISSACCRGEGRRKELRVEGFFADLGSRAFFSFRCRGVDEHVSAPRLWDITRPTTTPLQ